MFFVQQAISCKGQHSISYTLSRNQTVVVEYTHDKDTDMFQVRPVPFFKKATCETTVLDYVLPGILSVPWSFRDQTQLPNMRAL